MQTGDDTFVRRYPQTTQGVAHPDDLTHIIDAIFNEINLCSYYKRKYPRCRVIGIINKA